MYRISSKAVDLIENFKPEYQVAQALKIQPSRLSAIKKNIIFFNTKDNKTAQKLRKFLQLSEDDFFEEIKDD